MRERTYAMLKPDGVKMGLFPEVVERFKNVGLEITHT